MEGSSFASQGRPSIPVEAVCARCGVPVPAGDRYCWNCGAPVGGAAPNAGREDVPVEPGVGITDWISLVLLTVGSFGLGSAVAVVWENRTGRPLPGPVGGPLAAGALAAGIVGLLGLAYLLVLSIRNRD